MQQFGLKANFQAVSDILTKGNALQLEANQHDIIHVFDDGGFRELVLLKMFNLKTNAGRHGDDAIDAYGKLYELKTVNLVNTKGEFRTNPGITTCHHMNHIIIDRYRHVEGFLIGIFCYHIPARIYLVRPQDLEVFFKKWENQLITKGQEHINNPKIKYQHVLEFGELLYHDKQFDNIVEPRPKPKSSKKTIKVSENQLSLFD
ncbi:MULTISPECIES: hypothetical protein [unclassified Lysinibacillus]|uniref:hypothetical protein n=1 Tax=unclassified Lysinibacillus TaxID=2636778 RepID=UPI000884070B|nr:MULTISPECIES: hypothetical protein [unclassified Lysinibacillus]SCY87214.1 type II restriction enzyme [Lysinibacillus sp. SG9]SDB38358.1 type II restriction enzyme [Lysinibacillus sp. TC-37]SFT02380.1 type II restriction enzyme [Lysinibacillus sp. SG55]